jgi:hypothetical protein
VRLARFHDIKTASYPSISPGSNMSRINELLELADQCSELANDTPNPEARKTLQDMGGQYLQKADELRRTAITRATHQPNVRYRAQSGSDKDMAGVKRLTRLAFACQHGLLSIRNY